jgi:50S ribosomal subunit-associated GTPase HflX
MTAFDPGLAARPRLVVLNKADLLPGDFPREAALRAYKDEGLRTFMVSAKSGAGIPELAQALWTEAARLKPEPEEEKIFLP